MAKELLDFGMFFKPSFKCLKNKKINFIPAILKLETLLYQNIYILFHLILYSQSDFDSKKKRKWSNRKKNMPSKLFFCSQKLYRRFNIYLAFLAVTLCIYFCPNSSVKKHISLHRRSLYNVNF